MTKHSTTPSLPTTPSSAVSPPVDSSARKRVPLWIRLLYVPLVAVLSCVYFWGLKTENGHVILYSWLAIGCTGIIAMLFGLLYYKPSNGWAWWSFIVANVCFITGDTYYNTLAYVQNIEGPTPSFADILYLSVYAFFAIGMYILLRRRAPQRSGKGSLLDAATITVGLALVLWVYLVVPTLHADGSSLERAVAICYVLGDVLVWALLIRLLLVDIRTRAVQLLAVGAVGLVVSDIVYSVSQLNGIWQNNYVDIGWILFYTLWGAAALDPSMLRLAQPLPEDALRVRTRRLVLLSLAALVAPLILLIKSWQNQSAEFAGSIAAFAAVLFVLVILRLYTLMRQVSRNEAELRLNQEKNELLAISSHQLRTPLTTIKLYTEMLAQPAIQQDPVKVSKYGNVISEANEYMIEIVNSLIYTAQLDMGEVQFKREPVTVRQIVAQAEKDVQALVDSQGGKGVKLANKVPVGLTVLTDPPALTAILTAVFTNAIQYHASDNPKATITAVLNSKTQLITLTVTDNGTGIPEADKSKIFNKLFRASNARGMSPDGSGLSLYMARSALRYLEGTITLESTEGVGTSVTITLPSAS